ncbi:glycerophosphoryl diester phosphodiesterase membrane domain-containing protein [Enterococcus quebecensis]|uniref:Glycerophosphodiester phosphodiesterase n=1 Tax=Enterococcus quebecensis TaxID=903983 RepID=A0A1E5GQC0_9ENTE|nr:glycerophosphodiester phosphodiesterase [Enterococcus quebecensis]OEG14911.1 glycerophosphodiester phosphodiesterase [Enterococcus quebecensis]OJG74255.1 glycerophosphoryl diester phosphodiesterase [Enterococcus quebecensis]
MKYLKNSFKNMIDFFAGTSAYFRDVLLMHGFMLFILLPLLASSTRFILKQGKIEYLSYDTIPIILSKHPGVLLALVIVLFAIIIAVFFEFTFLLLSIFFIKKREPISLTNLLKGTILQLKKIRFSTILFFLFYFFFVLPFSGLGFNSDLLAKIKIPAFIMDFIFANRVTIIALVGLGYLVFFYLSVRLIFALPEMILRDVPFRQAVKESWRSTKNHFFKILGQFVVIGGSILVVFVLSYTVILSGQAIIESTFPSYALVSAVIAMTLLQFILLMNIIFSTVGVFYITIDYMDDEGFLPDLPQWFFEQSKQQKKEWTALKIGSFAFIAAIFGIGVGTYNTNYLSNPSVTEPLTISHRGVDASNGVQNTLPALEKTSLENPSYVEMDVQETKDKQFVVMHDFNLKKLTGVNKRPNQLTLEELTKLTVKENGMEAKVCSFDEYLNKAKSLNQKLLIEIKTTAQDSPDLVERFTKKYRKIILSEKHILHTLTFDTATQLKKEEPQFYVGYILPFNIVGPPVTNVDFFTMEYTTLNRNFINAAHDDGKKVYAWTVNDEDTMTRMMFYGVDGIVTDKLKLLNQTIRTDLDELTYSDKLLHFVIGIG